MAGKEAEDDWEYASEDGEDYEWEYSEEEDGGKQEKEEVVVTKKEDEDEDEELEDIDLPDPFGTEPIPQLAKKDVQVNGAHHVAKSTGNGTEEEDKKKRHKKKSRHQDKFEKFRKLEEKEKKGGEDYRTKKIHVRSKDPGKIARQFEKGDREEERSAGRGRKSSEPGRAAPKPPPVQIAKECKVCGKEPYQVERLVAEKASWHKNCFRCKECKKILTLDTYASHQGVIYCKPHHKELFQPKPVIKDLTEEIINKNIDFSTVDPIERHRAQERRMETIVRENRPVELEGVVKSRVDDSKWEGLESLDVGSKFLMFEKGGSQDRDTRVASDRYGIMEKLRRLQAGEDVEDLLAEIDEELPSDEEDEEDDGLTQVQRKAHMAERLFSEETKKEKLMHQRKAELKSLRDKLMAGTRDSILDQFDELSQKKIKKTQVDVRSQNAKKFMNMFNKGEIPEGVSSADRLTLEKEAELELMRSKKRKERDYFKKMETGELQPRDEEKKPKLLIGKIKDLKENGEKDDPDAVDPDCATVSRKFSFFEHYEEEKGKTVEHKVESERTHAARECKARSVLSKFKDMEQKVANGEEIDDPLLSHKRPLKRFTPPRKLVEESGSEYSDSEYSDSQYSRSNSSESYTSEDEEDEYIRNIREAARAKQLRAKFEEWEAQVGEDGGYTNLVDENGQALETASKLRNRFERMAIEEAESKTSKPKFQVKRFK